jgi:prepilin-type N-terminal cleavage/methylation domain-containing protein
MRFTRRSRRGFSLTEILMAVGILGVGMTMVASIFPVAVDQTRRANDTTMAALCARSAAAVMRARRGQFVNQHREYFKSLMIATDAGKVTDRERPAEFGVAITPTITDSKRNPGYAINAGANSIISKEMLVYNPNLFLYEAAKRYDVYAPGTQSSTTTTPYWPMWNAGNYVPVLYVTPIVPTDKRTDSAVAATSTAAGNYNTDAGPYRVTIVVFKSRGAIQDTITPNGDQLHPRTKTWGQNARSVTSLTKEPTFVAGSGDYIIDRSRHCGEAYLIDFANLDPLKTLAGVPGNATDPPILLACGIPAESTRWKCAPTNQAVDTAGSRNWYPLPGVVGVFHTVIGD